MAYCGRRGTFFIAEGRVNWALADTIEGMFF